MRHHDHHTELVWDRESAATAQARSGRLEIGPQCDWSPERLLTAAAESDLMSSFMSLAIQAGVNVLGYVSAAEAEWGSDPSVRPRLLIRPCIVIGRDQDRAAVERLVAIAGERSQVARALGDTLRLQADVVVVPPSEPG